MQYSCPTGPKTPSEPKTGRGWDIRAPQVAKRLESSADDGGILISDVVKSAVLGKDFVLEDRGEFDLKGFDESVRAWSVEW